MEVQYIFTAYPLVLKNEKAAINLADCIIFSHLIDDIVDDTSILEESQKKALEVLSRKLSSRIDLGTISEDDANESSEIEFRQMLLTTLLYEVLKVLEAPYNNRYVNSNLLTIVEDFEKKVQEVGGLYNKEVFTVGLLKVIYAGLIQTTGKSKQRIEYIKVYKYLCRIFIGRIEKDDSDFPIGVYISWGSGVQGMFVSIVDPLNSLEEIRIIDFVDVLLSPLVFLVNSHKEKKEISFGDNKEFVDGFIDSMESVKESLNILKRSPILKPLYLRKLKQLKAAILQTLFRGYLKDYEINNKDFKKLRNFYKRALLWG